jgi:ubiquinone/menaquinone biosynthesis C-methylase UbiE
VLYSKCKEVIGVDSDLKVLRLIKKGVRSEIICADAYHLPFRDNVFNTVFAGKLIEHLDNVGKFLLEILRVTSPKARFIGTTPNPWELVSLILSYLVADNQTLLVTRVMYTYLMNIA